MTTQTITGWAILVDSHAYARETHALWLTEMIYRTRREAVADRRSRFIQGARVVRVTITIEGDV